MNVIAGILVALVAAEHLGFLVLEMFLWTTPYALKTFGMSEDSGKLGVKLLATYVPMNNHMVFAAVEADDMATVREFAFQSRLGQWNTIEIYQTSTLEEALAKADELPTIYS